MDRIVIYISFDCDSVMNYFHMYVDDERTVSYRNEEEVDEIFQTLKSVDKRTQIFIVKDKDALSWEFERAFTQNGLTLLTDEQEEGKENVVETLFKSGKVDTESIVFEFCGKILHGKTVPDKHSDNQETLRQAKEILMQGGEEMTELARIIREKYERMSKND